MCVLLCNRYLQRIWTFCNVSRFETWYFFFDTANNRCSLWDNGNVSYLWFPNLAAWRCFSCREATSSITLVQSTSIEDLVRTYYNSTSPRGELERKLHVSQQCAPWISEALTRATIQRRCSLSLILSKKKWKKKEKCKKKERERRKKNIEFSYIRLRPSWWTC